MGMTDLEKDRAVIAARDNARRFITKNNIRRELYDIDEVRRGGRVIFDTIDVFGNGDALIVKGDQCIYVTSESDIYEKNGVRICGYET